MISASPRIFATALLSCLLGCSAAPTDEATTSTEEALFTCAYPQEPICDPGLGGKTICGCADAIPSVIAVALADKTAYAIDDTGRVVAWGDGAQGALGTNALSAKYPSLVFDPTKRIGPANDRHDILTAGKQGACARRISDQTVQCWGVISTSPLVTSWTPMTIQGFGNVKKLAQGRAHACAIQDPDGSVWCWGDNNAGQLGTPNGPGRTTAAQVVWNVANTANGGTGPNDLVGLTAVAAGGDTTCVRRWDGAVFCWGDNEHGAVGIGTTVGTQWFPNRLAGWNRVSGASTIFGGGDGTFCAPDADLHALNPMLCWGANGNGQAGLDTNFKVGPSPSSSGPLAADIGAPAPASALKGPSVALGSTHSCGARVDAGGLSGSVQCVGTNANGELGLGDHETVPSAQGSNPKPIPGVVFSQVAVGATYSCGLATTASSGLSNLWCWGNEPANGTWLSPALIPWD
jgi:hypothetical protein